MINWLLNLFKRKPVITSITDPYRINRIIRSEWNAGNCKQLNQSHHYLVMIDGEGHRMGIAEILNAIESLDQYENRQYERFTN